MMKISCCCFLLATFLKQEKLEILITDDFLKPCLMSCLALCLAISNNNAITISGSLLLKLSIKHFWASLSCCGRIPTMEVSPRTVQRLTVMRLVISENWFGSLASNYFSSFKILSNNIIKTKYFNQIPILQLNSLSA